MAITSGILLAIYIVAIVLVINWPTRRRHPEDAQAVGCLTFIALGCALMGGILYLAVRFQLNWLVYIIFALTAYPALFALPQLVWKGWKSLKARTAAKGRRILGEELTNRLAGQTHVFHRRSLDPDREYDELKFYSPDGKLICYERENGTLRRLECDVTWTVRADALRTFGEFGLGSQNSYTVWEAQGGHIGYYIHVPFSRLNGKLSGTTTEICEGAPRA